MNRNSQKQDFPSAPASVNQSPEQIARDLIDHLLRQANWIIQPKNKINFSAGVGVAIQEYQTDAGPADYTVPK